MPRLTRAPAAKALGIHPQTLRARQKRGEIQAVFEDGKWWFDVPDEVIAEAERREATERSDALVREVARVRAGFAGLVAELERIERKLSDRATASSGHLATPESGHTDRVVNG